MSESLKTGDLVSHRNLPQRQFYIKKNGTSCYLFVDKERTVEASPRTCSSHLLTRVVVAVSAEQKKKPSDGGGGGGGGAKQGFFYVGSDHQQKRAPLKFGITKNLSQRLASYRTAQPDFHFLIRVETADHRQLETQMMAKFAADRMGTSEVFSTQPYKVRAALVELGYRNGADDIYRLQTKKK